MATSVAPATSPVNHPPQVALPPRILPNSSRLDDTFPVLGFHIYSDRAAWFEVLLTTDRALFDPGSASRRKTENFYSSRQDSQLIPIQLGNAVYLAPAAVVRGFVSGNPRPSEIYYTVVAYSDDKGANPVFAQPPETLAASAPSVMISRHYGSDRGWGTFGMDPSKLQRWQPPATQASGLPPSSLSLGQGAISADEDRAGGEDGRYAEPPEHMQARQQDAEYGEYDEGQSSYEQPEPEDAWSASAQESDYEDGYGEPPPSAAGLMASIAQQTSYRHDDPEPQELQGNDGDDDGRYSSVSYSRAASSDDDDPDEQPQRGYRMAASAASYGDEADEGEWNGSSQSLAAMAPAATPVIAPILPAAPLTIEKKRDLIGKLGEYTSTSADAEFNGVLGPEHPAYRRYHLGLSYGIVGFNQDTGHLGQLLLAMRERDSVKFGEIFGVDADTLLRVATARGPRSMESVDGRSVRVQPVAGADLWQEPWLGRFREAGCHKRFQAVQNRLAAEWFLDPVLPFAHYMGMNTERALAIAMDRASQMGVAASEQWIANACGPLQTPQQRQQALAGLGFSDLRTFQAAHPGIESDGQWGPRTHAALVHELRDSGRSPVPLPTLDQMLDALVRRSAQSHWFARIQALRNDIRFGDVPIQLASRHHEGMTRQTQR